MAESDKMENMPEMNLEIGSEKKITDFIKNIKKDDKVVLISHTDVDGIVAAKVVNEIIKVKKSYL